MKTVIFADLLFKRFPMEVSDTAYQCIVEGHLEEGLTPDEKKFIVDGLTNKSNGHVTPWSEIVAYDDCRPRKLIWAGDRAKPSTRITLSCCSQNS